MADIFELLNSLGLKGKTKTGPVEKIVVCLGNPGKEYEKTRHNVGFMAADYMAQKRDFKISRLKFKSLTGECEIAGVNALFIKPSTFMNLSGQAVVEAMEFYKLAPSDVVVIFDDASLQPGTLRIRSKGSDGGHKGMASIIYLSGEDMFPRIKIGVGAKPHPDYDMADWVLGTPSPEDQKLIDDAIKRVDQALELVLCGNTEEAMNRFNQ